MGVDPKTPRHDSSVHSLTGLKRARPHARVEAWIKGKSVLEVGEIERRRAEDMAKEDKRQREQFAANRRIMDTTEKKNSEVSARDRARLEAEI